MNNDLLFEVMTDGVAQMMTAIAMVDIDEEERNDLIERQTAIIVQLAAILGYKNKVSFDAFVTDGQELAAKLNAKYQRMK